MEKDKDEAEGEDKAEAAWAEISRVRIALGEADARRALALVEAGGYPEGPAWDEADAEVEKLTTKLGALAEAEARRLLRGAAYTWTEVEPFVFRAVRPDPRLGRIVQLWGGLPMKVGGTLHQREIHLPSEKGWGAAAAAHWGEGFGVVLTQVDVDEANAAAWGNGAPRELPVIYIAGPYSNICAAAEAAREVWRLGAVALCPHLNVPFDGVVPDGQFLAGGLELLGRCDALYLFTERESEGAAAEVEHAVAWMIPVLRTPEQVELFLELWRNEKGEADGEGGEDR